MTTRRKRGRPRRGEPSGNDDHLDLVLAREFQQRPAFYDRSHPQYRNRDFVEGLWFDMAQSVGQNVAIVKSRMVQLRNRYNLEKRRVEMLQDQYNDPNITSQWPLYNNLTYLGDHIKTRRSFTKEIILRPKSAPFPNSRPVRFAYCSDTDDGDENNAYPTCSPIPAAALSGQNNLVHNIVNENQTNNGNGQPILPSPILEKEEDGGVLNENPNLMSKSNFCKFRAFGQFLASSLMEMNQCEALNLVEKFTTDLVKSLIIEANDKSPEAQLEALLNGHN